MKENLNTVRKTEAGTFRNSDSLRPSATIQSVEFSRQEYWSELFPPPGDLQDPRIEPTSPVSPALQADSSPLNHQGSP